MQVDCEASQEAKQAGRLGEGSKADLIDLSEPGVDGSYGPAITLEAGSSRSPRAAKSKKASVPPKACKVRLFQRALL